MTVLTTASLSLFSAYAEVFLRNSFDIAYSVAFLCLRRGVSPSTAVGVALDGFSLPTQRCFYIEAVRPDLDPLFSAYAEVFPGLTTRSVLSAGLFSAYAEVFLTVSSAATEAQTFLCLRRGVSLCARVCFRG